MSTRHAAVLGLALAMLFAGSAFWLFSGRVAQSGPALKPVDARTIATGKEIYTVQCASCHGANLEGQPNWKSPGADGLMPAPPHDETGHTWHHPDQVLFDITKFGVAKMAGLKNYESAMPIYEGVLNDEEIIAVLSYIKSTWPERIRVGHERLNKRYAEEAKP